MKTTKLLINEEVLSLLQSHISTSYRNTPAIQERWMFRYLYIFNKIYRGQQFYSTGVTIHQRDTAKLLKIDYTQMSVIIKFYLDTNIIFRSSGYTPGIKSYSYLITPSYNNNIIIHKSSYSYSYDLESNINTLSMQNTFYTTYFNHLKNIKVNLPLKLFINYNNISHSYGYDLELDPLQQLLIEEMNEGNIYFNQPTPNSRIYHPICNLNRNHRKYMSWNGKGVMQSDVVASQVFLAVIQYVKASNTAISELPADIVELIEYCKNGTFYEVMMTETGHKDRNKYKQSFFKDLFFCKETSMERTKIGKAFKKLFPTMYQSIYDFKSKAGYKEYSISLQKFEWTLIREILEKLYQQGFEVINLHDAILYPEDVDSDTIEGIIKEIYQEKVGLIPSLKTEQISLV